MTVDEFAAEWHNDCTYIEAVTSGSTGAPKTIKLSKKDMIASALATNEFFNLKEGDNFICPIDFKYIGAKMMYVRAQIAKGNVLALPASNVFRFDETAHLLALVPSQVDNLVENPDLICRTKHLIIGGAALSEIRAERLIKAGIDAYVTYGMTETASHVALAKVGHDVFTALTGVSFEKDQRDCLIINMLDRDSSRVVTNDIVELLSPHSFKWLGRYDNIINSGGIKIIPELIESAVKSILNSIHFQYSDVAVVKGESEKWGEKAVCLIETSRQLGEEDVKVLKADLKLSLDDPRKCPDKILCVKELPRTANGKIDRLSENLRKFAT